MKDYDEKREILIDEGLTSVPAPRLRPSLRERLAGTIIPTVWQLLSTCVLLWFIYTRIYHAPSTTAVPVSWSDEKKWVVDGENTTRVALEAHIMSKCPDAKDCLQQLVVPTMARMSDKVDFTLSYIGSVDPDSDEVTCKHGPSECLGNIIQLCAANVYPDPKLYLGFANCMTSDYADIPQRELVEGCAMEHGIDFGKLNSCISQEGHGMELLRKSVERSHDNGVSTSCTVRLEGHVRCVRDGGEWYNCPGGSSVSDLVRETEKLYDEHNSF